MLTMVVWAITYITAAKEQEQRFNESAERARQLAVFFERYTLAIFRYGDAYLKMVRREYVKHYDLEIIRSLIREIPLNQAIASHVTIIDETGTPLLVSGYSVKAGTTAKDRDYFKFQQTSEGDQLLISLPHRGRNTGKIIIRLVRRFNKADGQFGGVIFVALEARTITDFFNTINLGAKSSATLIGTDKRIRARSSYGRLGPGQDISGSRIWRELEKSPVGLYLQTSVVDNITRYYAYRLLSELPLIVAIGVSTEDISTNVSQTLFPIYVIALLATVLIITMAVLFSREVMAGQKLAASESHVRTVVETVQDGIISIDESGHIQTYSSGARNMFGYEPDKIIGQHVSVLADEADRAKPDQYIRNYLDTGKSNLIGQRSTEVRARRKDGTVFPAELSIGEMRRDQACVFVGTLRDITEKKQAERALFEEQERAQVTLHSIGDCVISTDAEGRVEYLNPIAEALTGWPIEEAKGQPLNEVFNIINEETREPAQYPIERCLREGRIVDLANHMVLISRSGAEYSIEDSAAPIHDKDGVLLGVVLVFKDVTKARQLSKQVSHQASHDALTGLINRYEFENCLQQILDIAQNNDKTSVFCYLDLDQFKLVNDTCGHMAGDELLRQMAQLMKSCIRQSDTLGRLGGDEFGLLMMHCSVDEAQRVAELLVEKVGNFRFVWDDGSFNIGVSIGLVEIGKDSGSIDWLMRAADSACYTAKELGRNRTHVYREEDEALARRYGEMQWAVRLPRALEEGRFRLFYHSIMPVDGSRSHYPDHYELLLRMESEAGGLVSPGNFLPAAERYNFSNKIDRWVINYTFRWLHNNPIHLEKLKHCSINLSGISLSDGSFLSYVVQQLEEFEIPFGKICFEITETVAIANLSSATSFIKALRQLGCRFALDDFGSGLSSFAYLKNLQVDILKIDGLFVKDILDNPMDLAMVKSINEIGHIMGKQTIAEFVENDAILDKLREIGVDYAQGYAISKPKPLEELLSNS